MSTFLNIDLDGKVPKKFIWKHLFNLLLWMIAISLLIFRVDVYAINPDLHWIPGILPILFTMLVLVIIFKQKWYFSIITLIYPILLVFWFIPKIILQKGKIYLFSHYVDYIFTRLVNYKRTIFHYSLFAAIILLIILTDNQYVRASAMVIMCYFYFRFVFGYLRASFSPAKIFGNSIREMLIKNLEDTQGNKNKFIESITKESKEDKELLYEERKKKKLRTLVMWNFGLNYVSNNLSGFKGTKGFVLSWLLQLAYFFIISLLFFTFLNFQLYNIEPNNYIVQETPSTFDFFYYTLKNISATMTESIKPDTMVAKIIEIVSYAVMGVFILILGISLIFSLRHKELRENVVLAEQFCSQQNQYIVNHIEDEFGLTIESAKEEFADIKRSVEKLRKIIDKLF